MIRPSASDDQLHTPGDAAEIVFAGLLRDAALAENARHPRVLHVDVDADPAVEAELGAAVDDKSGVPRIDVFAGLVEAGRFFIQIQSGARAGVRSDARRQPVAVTSRRFERR